MKASPFKADGLIANIEQRVAPTLDRELDDEWARQLAGMLASQAQMDSQGGGGASTGRGDANLETAADGPTAGHSSTLVGPQNSDADGDNRLTLTVTTEQLGQVSIVVDRAEGGVRVVLGVGDRGAERAIEPDKSALIQALRTVGLDVHSVNIVRRDQVGTVLAQSTSARSGYEKSKSTDDKDGDKAHPRKKHKRIQLIG